MIIEATARELRETGISAIGDIQWGTHFCCFYETKEDLLETLVAYFKAGLDNKEFCVWVVSSRLDKEEAKRALAQAVPNLDRYLAEGILEIHSHQEWYLRDGRWDSQRVLQSWREKLQRSSANGFSGFRAAGDGGWVQNDNWMAFCKYEEQVSAMLVDQRSVILCTYPLTTSSGDQVFDVAHVHDMAVARRNGSWETVETSELKQAKAEIKRLNEELEEKVEERTRELVAANAALRSEIVERKVAEESVRQAEDRVRLIIDTIPNMAWSLRPDGVVDFVNQRWLDYTGLSFEEAIRDPNSIVHPDDLSPAVEKWLPKMAVGDPHEVELRLRRTDGEYRWFLVRVAPLRDAQGNVVKWYGVSTDIEDRKEAEMQSRALIDAIPQQIWSAPRDGATDYCNDRWRSYTGLELEDVQGYGWQTMVHPDDRDRVLEAWRESVANGTPYEQEERHRGTDGKYRWFLSRAVPLRDVEGRIVRWYGTNTDIEDRRQAEEKLRHSKVQLAQAQRLAHIGSWDWDLRTNAVTWSDELYHIFGLEPGTVSAAGQVDRFIHPDDLDLGWDTVKRAVASKEPYDYYHRILRPDGTERIARSRGSIVSDERGEPIKVFGATQDVTELKRAEKELEEASRQLRFLSRRLFHIQEEERRHLARELHDEIGQTLTAAKINLKIIAPDVPAKIGGRLDDSIQLLDRLLGQVRELSLDLRPPLLDELGLVPTLRWLVDHQAQRAGLRVMFTANVDHLEIDPDVRTACFRVAQEAITNVIRHSGAKNVAVEVRREAERLTLSVRDDGVGFDPAVIQQRTAPDFTLGLVSMKERALLARGGFEVHSAPGQCTEIRAWFPLAPDERPSPEIV